MSVEATEAVDTVVGRTLDGRFEVKDLLGEGGLGIVYLAHDMELDRDVALKLLIPRYRGRPARESRLLAEAAMARSVEHPRVVRCLEWGRVVDLGGCPYASFDVVEGTSLNERLAWGGAFPPLRAAEILRELAVVVHECHAAGVVHRDVSVQNVFLGEDESITLIDFSHAARLEEARERPTLLGEIPGTPWFMSPEQARGEQASPSMDVFALGVVGYELLTGKNPYRNVQADIFAELQGREELRQPKIDCRVFTDVPEPLAEVVNRCLALRASERTSLAGLLEELDAALAFLRSSVAEVSAGEEATAPLFQKMPSVIAAGARPAGDETMAQLVRGGVAMPSAKHLKEELGKAERDECLVANRAQLRAAMADEGPHVQGDGSSLVGGTMGSPWRRRSLFALVGLVAFAVGVVATRPTPSRLVPAVTTSVNGEFLFEGAVVKPDVGQEEVVDDLGPEAPEPNLEPTAEPEPTPESAADEAPAGELRKRGPRRPKPDGGSKVAPIVEADTDRCRALRASVEADHGRGASREVLRKTRERECWTGQDEDRLFFRASALFDQRDYEACARTAEHGKSGDNRDLARVCASKKSE